MSKEAKNNASGGVGFVGLLQIAFIVLKLCGVIDWSWWWVFAPTWGSTLFAMCVLAVALLIVMVAECMKGMKKNG